MKKIKVLWVDADHLWVWDSHFWCLEEEGGYDIATLGTLCRKSVLQHCAGRDILVIHCGTRHPFADLRGLLEVVRARFPNLKIGLETNVKHSQVKDLVDFYIVKPLTVEELKEELQAAV